MVNDDSNFLWCNVSWHLCSLGILSGCLPEVCGLPGLSKHPLWPLSGRRALTPTPEIATSNMSFWHLAQSDFRRKVRKPFFAVDPWPLESRMDVDKKIGKRNSIASWMTICYSGSFYLSASLSFYNLDQYLDPCFPVKYLSSCKHSQATKPGPAQYITAITEQLSQPPWPSNNNSHKLSSRYRLSQCCCHSDRAIKLRLHFKWT